MKTIRVLVVDDHALFRKGVSGLLRSAEGFSVVAEAEDPVFGSKGCVKCHSIRGVGGETGPDLGRISRPRSFFDLATALWNHLLRMTERMELLGIPRYFSGPGSIPRGWAVATYKGCLTCHAVRGERGKPASDLTQARGLDSPPAVIAALWNHAIVTPKTPAGQKAPWPEFRPDEMADLVALLQTFADHR